MTKPDNASPVAPSASRNARRQSLKSIRWKAARPMLFAAVLISVLYLALAALVIAVDPHNVYRWGAEPRIEAGDTPRDLVIDWIDVAAKDPSYNTFLVGSSITAMYTPEYMREILGPDTNAANLSYGGPRPIDRDLVLDRLVDNPAVKRVILTYDWTYMEGADVANRGFPTFLYDDDITNDLRMVNPPTIRRTFDILRGKTTYSNPDDAGYDAYIENMYARFQSPPELSRIKRMVERNRTGITQSSGKTCDSFTALNEQLIPDLQKLSARGAQVDILFPIVSYAFYYVRRNDISPTLLDEQMVARRCLVNAVADLPNVSIFALDNDPTVAGDLANYREVGHIYNPAILRRFMMAIKNGSDRVTRENIAEYEEEIRTAVKDYDPNRDYTDLRLVVPDL
ncbi:TonB-dependent receptor [Aurantiacibacter rhizosphaerae]|uniref:TonB-dependent receptor n=1 Tax=Aurantiacibacter rhizosphaerae TaxID=2691582 RepID=A0A844XCS8_9SPHN|nr:TonB-dependent receptor [Aurantiacibacter rhizosphaerae]MWV27569.1 TonB-dependent receptor [Aurantiacibacter rhizosphaerae]